MQLLCVPNISTGVADAADTAFQSALAGGAEALDVHRDADHGRTVYSLVCDATELAQQVATAAAAASLEIDLTAHQGVHPHIGAVDVAPVVYLDQLQRPAALASALALGSELGERGIAVFLYGELAAGRTRAELRLGGLDALMDRVASGDLRPDFGPTTIDPRRGATLVAARPPLLAFNLVLGPEVGLAAAREIAAAVREGGSEGLPGVRAIGLELESQKLVQVSTNIEDPAQTTPAKLLAAVQRHATVVSAELVGLAPAGVFDGFPSGIPIAGFDPDLSVIQRRLNLG